MNLTKKVLSRILACTLITGLTAPYTIPDALYTVNSSIYAADTSVSDEYIGSPLSSAGCSLYTDGTKSFNMNGRTYYQGIVMGDDCDKNQASFCYNVEGVNTLSFSLGHVDNSDSGSAEFSVYLDNVPGDKITLSQNEMISDYSLDVSKASVIRVIKSSGNSKYGIANISIDDLHPSKAYSVPQYKNSKEVLDGIFNKGETSVHDGTDNYSHFNMSGRRYFQGIVPFNFSKDEYSGFSLNVENLKNISFDLGHLDKSEDNDCELLIYLDNQLKDTVKLTHDMLIRRYTLDVADASVLRVCITERYSDYGLGDITADELDPERIHVVPTYTNGKEFVFSGYGIIRTEIFDFQTNGKSFFMYGKRYGQGIVMGDHSCNDNACISFNVENLDSVSFTIGHDDDDSNATQATLEIYCDNELIQTIELDRNMVPAEYTIDVSKTSTLRLSKPNDAGEYGLGNFTIKSSLTENVPAVTSAPKVTTKVPVTTSAPKVTTKVPVTTSAPKVTAKAPTTTSAPKVTTKAPVTTSALKVTTKAPATTSAPEPSPLAGDLNGDGSLSAADLVIISKCILSPDSVKPEILKLADLNNDSTVNVFDMIRLKKDLLY